MKVENGPLEDHLPLQTGGFPLPWEFQAEYLGRKGLQAKHHLIHLALAHLGDGISSNSIAGHVFHASSCSCESFAPATPQMQVRSSKLGPAIETSADSAGFEAFQLQILPPAMLALFSSGARRSQARARARAARGAAVTCFAEAPENGKTSSPSLGSC